jgi:malate/lactate dehydrogenase
LNAVVSRALTVWGVQDVAKITVVGAAGGIGQPLSMLLKLNVPTDILALYDVSPAAPGVAADVSHVDTKGKVRHDFGLKP